MRSGSTTSSAVGAVLRPASWISGGDLMWVAGTVVTIRLGWYSAAGAVAMALVGALVGAFGGARATLARRMRAHRSDD